MSRTVYLVIGVEPRDNFPLAGEDGFNGDPVAWTAYTDRDDADAKCTELNDSDDHRTQWQVVPRRVKGKFPDEEKEMAEAVAQ